MVGSWEYPDYAPSFDQGPGWITAGSGRIDLTGKPLGEALYTRVAFEQAQGPFIAVRPICHEGRHSPSAWKMTNAFPSWSYRGYEGKKTEIEVYARCAKVELKLNGRSLGIKKAKNNCVFRFRTPYQNGRLEAIAYDANGKVIGTDCLTTAGEKTELRMEAEESAVRVGHMAFVRIRLTDEQGITKPTEREAVTLTVEGGRLVACGSACPYYARSYLDSVCDTYYGEALAMIEVQGDVTVHAASAAGEASLAIRAKAE